MAKNDRIVRYSSEELVLMPNEADWAKVRAITPDDIERIADEGDGPLPEGWEKSIILGVPKPKKDLPIRLDSAVPRWFKAQGPGYQTGINAVLQAFVQVRVREENATVKSR